MSIAAERASLTRERVSSLPRSERDTLRKRLIRAIVSERRAILLDELRWSVLRREAPGRKLKEIRTSAMTSFARTVREYMPELSLHEIGLGEGSQCPIRLIAATAVYRLREQAKLDAFLKGPSPTVEWRYVTDLPVGEFGKTARYSPSRFAIPQYHLHLVDLYSAYGAQQRRVARIKLPPAHKVTIVAAEDAWSIDQVLANQTWQVIGG